jgi:protein CpxP
LTIAICGLALLAASQPALAQGKGDRQHGRGPGMRDGHRLEHLAQRLELSDGQREEMKEAFADRFEAGAEARRGLFEARQILDELIHADSFDEAAIREAAAALAALEADGAVERARQAQRIRQILTPDQLAEFEQMRADRGGFARRGPRERGSRSRGHRGLQEGGGPPPVGE